MNSGAEILRGAAELATLARWRLIQSGRVGQRIILRVKFRASVVSQLIAALVAQWIEHPPPKGRVTRSIRVEGAIGQASSVLLT